MSTKESQAQVPMDKTPAKMESARKTKFERNNNSSDDEVGEDAAREKECDNEESTSTCVHEVRDSKFTSINEAWQFYRSYGRSHGFDVRKSTVHRSPKDGVIIHRLFVCSREGQRAQKYRDAEDRIREPRGETRTGCKAHLNIRFKRAQGLYVVTSFEDEHNHEVTMPQRVHFLRASKYVGPSDMAEAKTMHGVGIPTPKIMDYMVRKYNGYENCGFTQRDLSNCFDVEYRDELLDGDAEAAIAYFSAKQDSDPLQYYKYKLDGENRLEILFWADANAREDYYYFGDVLAFDTTYRTNKYNRPFVMLVGVNNHYETTMFGCALLPNELESTYTWVLDTFLDAMHGKKPWAVITDGDKTMGAAIGIVFPDTRHRLCKWHIQRNVASNIHVKGFLGDFNQLMDEPLTTEEFEACWASLVEKYDLGANAWLPKLYSKRKLWANAFLKGTFFANMRTTGRCEGFNALMNGFLNRRLRIYKFVQTFDRALLKIRNRELLTIHRSEETCPVISTKLQELERHASDVYTRNLFFKVREQLQLVIQVFGVQHLQEHGDDVYYMSMYNRHDSTWHGRYNATNEITMKCSCLLFETCGLPCCHMFHVMKIKDIQRIPQSLIMRRWTKEAKPEPSSGEVSNISDPPEQAARYGALTTQCNKMAFFASQTSNGWKIAMREIENLKGRMEDMFISNKDNKDGQSQAKRCFGVRDPEPVVTKGNPGKKKQKPLRKYSQCRRPGHNKNTCPQLGSVPTETHSEYHNSYIVDTEALTDEYTMFMNSNTADGVPEGNTFNFYSDGFDPFEERPGMNFGVTPNDVSATYFAETSWGPSNMADFKFDFTDYH